MSDYVFTMYRADKFYGSDRQVLANISLSLPARREDRRARPERRRQVDAAADHGRARGAVERRRRARPGATVGMLAQEPELDPEQNVRENVEDGVRELRDLLDRFNADLGAVRRAGRRLRHAARRAGEGAGARSTAPTPGASTRRSTARWTRCGCPRATAT